MCVDEWGPLEIKPIGGVAWARRHAPQRMRATYHRAAALHDHPRFLALLKRLRIRPVWTSTEASWLNPIEAHFGALKRFTLANTDDPSHAVRRRRVYRYLRYRHHRARTQEHRLAAIRSLSTNNLESQH